MGLNLGCLILQLTILFSAVARIGLCLGLIKTVLNFYEKKISLRYPTPQKTIFFPFFSSCVIAISRTLTILASVFRQYLP